jgi:hypothetical protein
MSSCEKCWSDSRWLENYHEVLARRDGATEPKCTPEEQAGDDATNCPDCGRRTRHQWTRECMNTRCPSRLLDAGTDAPTTTEGDPR